MSIWVWVLTYTVLGAEPEHNTIAKYSTQPECQQSLDALREERRSRGQHIVGSCRQVLKSAQANK